MSVLRKQLSLRTDGSYTTPAHSVLFTQNDSHAAKLVALILANRSLPCHAVPTDKEQKQREKASPRDATGT